MKRTITLTLIGGKIPLAGEKGVLCIPDKDADVRIKGKNKTLDEILAEAKKLVLKFNPEYQDALEWFTDIGEPMDKLFKAIRVRKFTEKLSLYEQLQREINRSLVISGVKE